EISSRISGIVEGEIKRAQVCLRLPQLEKIVGVKIPEADILTILDALDMEIVERKVDSLELLVPTSKADVVREADVIEEILRIYGFNRIPVGTKLEISLNSGQSDLQLIYRNRISMLLSGMGLDETMGLSFSLPQYLPTRESAAYVRIHNASKKRIKITRSYFNSNALVYVEYNQKRQNNVLNMYEFDRSYA